MANLTIEEKERRKEKRKQNKYNSTHKMINGIDHKLCDKHHIFFPEESPWVPSTTEYFYYNDKNTLDYLHPECKRCGIEKGKQWVKDNKEKHRDRARISYKENKWDIKGVMRKSAKNRRENGKYLNWQRTKSGKESSIKAREKRKPKEHIMYDIEWDNLKKYFDNKCCYCGLPIEKHYIKRLGVIKQGDFHRDHVIDDGRNDLKNALPSCEVCNSEKHTKTLNEFYNLSNPNYTREKYLKIVQWLRYDYKEYILPKRRYKGQRMVARIKEVEEAKRTNKKNIKEINENG